MVNWRDCIVPNRFTRNDVCVWVAYQKSNPRLPIAIAQTAEELARKVGVSTSTVISCWSKYHRVKVGVEHETYTKN